MNWFQQKVDPFINTPGEAFDAVTGGHGYTPGDGWGLFKDTMERGPEKAWGDFNSHRDGGEADGESLLSQLGSFIDNPRSVFSGAESKIDKLKSNLKNALMQERVEQAVKSEAPKMAGPFAMMGGMAGIPQPSGKTFLDYMNDPGIINVANASIIAQNAAIGRENRDRRKQMVRDIRGENASHREYQRVAGDVQDRHRDDTLAINSDVRDAQGEASRAIRDVAMELGLVGMSDEKARDSVHQEAQSTNNEIARQDAATNDMMAQLGENGQDALASMAQAEAKGNAENVRSIRDSAIDEVSARRAQAADNWFNLTPLTAQVASEAMTRDQAAEAMAMDAWKTKFGAMDAWRQTNINKQLAEAQYAAAAAKAAGGGLDTTDAIAIAKMWANDATSPTGQSTTFAGENNEEVSIDQRKVDSMTPKEYEAYAAQMQQVQAMTGVPIPIPTPVWLNTPAESMPQKKGTDKHQWWNPLDWGIPFYGE